MKTKIMQLLFLLCLVCGVRANKLTLPLNEAKRLALEQNQSLKIAEDRYKASLAQVKQSDAKNAPQIGLELKPTTSIRDGLSLRTQVGLSFSQPRTGSPQMAKLEKISRFDLEIADRALEEVQRQLLWEVETAYFNLLKAEQLLLARDEGVRRAQAQLQTAELQEELGVGTRLDVMRMQVSLSRSKQSQLEAQNNVRRACLNLAILVGLPLETTFITSSPELTVKIPALDQALGLITSHSEILDQYVAVEKAKLALEEVQRQKEMKFALVSNYNIEWGTLSLGMDKDSLSGNIAFQNSRSQTSNWEVGVQASWNLADGGGRDAAILEAEKLLASQRGQLQSKLTELEQKLRGLYLDLEVAEAKLQTSEANLKTAKEAWNVAKLKYDNDAGSVSELLDVEVTLVEAQTEYINTYFDHLLKQSELRFNLCLEEEVL